jgi:predicted dithiol-disulfide oxidoreductase (DUF899 family)
MGWTVPWVSSHGSDVNYDFHTTIDPSIAPAVYDFAPMQDGGTGEVPGTSVFLRDGSEVFHTYSSYARGGDAQAGTYTYLDLTPLGRQEDWEQPCWSQRRPVHVLAPPSRRIRRLPSVPRCWSWSSPPSDYELVMAWGKVNSREGS